MKQNQCCAAVTLIVVILSCVRDSRAFDTAPHSDVTRSVLAERGYSEDAIKIVQVQNWLTDYYSSSPTIAKSKRAAFERLHFDNLYTAAAVREYWTQLMRNAETAAVSAARKGDEIAFLTALGIATHAVQDFYAHSNWVEMHPRESASTYRTETFLSSNPPASLFTGKYPADRKIGPSGQPVPPDAAVHGGYADGLNHDSPIRPRWDESYVFAYVATHEIAALFEKWADAADPAFRGRFSRFSLSPENRKKLDFDLKAALGLSMWIDLNGADGHWKGDKSGSSRFFNSFTSKWVGKDSSVIVREMTDGAMPQTMAAGLYEKSSAAQLPKMPKFSLPRRAVLVRTTLIRETDDVGRLEPNIDPAGRADFYANLAIGGQIYRERVMQEQREAKDPWFTIHFVDASLPELLFGLEVFDEDDWDPDGRYKDDVVDVNPAAGKAGLTFWYRLADGSVRCDITGIFDSPAKTFSSAGAKPDKNRAHIEGYFSSALLR